MSGSILMIEDDHGIADNVVYMLEVEGYAVVHAETGDAGLAEFRRTRPRLVLLDIGLPGISGYQLLKAIRHTDASVPAGSACITRSTSRGSPSPTKDCTCARPIAGWPSSANTTPTFNTLHTTRYIPPWRDTTSGPRSEVTLGVSLRTVNILRTKKPNAG